MTGPFDRRDLDDTELHDPVSEELEHYARLTADRPPSRFADRVMTAVEREPLPRRGLAAWLGTFVAGRGPAGRWAQVSVVAATLLLVLAGVLAVGQLADRTLNNVGTSPSPAATESMAPSPAPSILPSVSATPSPSASPSASPVSASPSASPSDDESEEPDETPEPSEDDDDDDDNSGPGGGGGGVDDD